MKTSVRYRNKAIDFIVICFIALSVSSSEKSSDIDAERPRYALEGHENELYHDLRFTDRATQPDYYAFLDQSWVFNRNMQWQSGPGNTLLCYSAGGDLLLTDKAGPSEWFSDPINEVLFQENGRMKFIRHASRNRDCVVLPGFQFHVDQHPQLEVEVKESTGDWQFCVLIKGRSGPPCFATEWRTGAGTITVDLQTILRNLGYKLHFAELTFAMGLWTDTPHKMNEVEFSVSLQAAPCLVGCLPVIRSMPETHDGIAITALVLDGEGKKPSSDSVEVTATINTIVYPMKATDGIWVAYLQNVPPGDYAVKLESRGAISATSDVTLRITDGQFISYNSAHNSLEKAGIIMGPLSGSFQGMAHFVDIGTPTERLVQGHEAFDTLSRTGPPKLPWHYWDALTESELDTRFKYLAENGWRLLHLCQHWGSWEKLDAGGRIAPHGAEQAALYYRVAARHGLVVLQALSHYPYGTKFTRPYRQYLEAGFHDEDWKDADSKFTTQFHGYLTDYATLFHDETAIVALTTSGEGDIAAGPDRVNDTCAFMKENMPYHLFLSEPIHRMTKLPPEHTLGWHQALFGSRFYWIGDDIEPETDLGIECKFMQLGPCFMAEGNWPCPRLYAEVSGRTTDSWEGTPAYRLRLRDSLYFGLIYRFPMLFTWEEQWAEDEHRLVEEIRKQVNWSQSFQQPPIALRVNSDHVREKRAVLAEYERFFSNRPISTGYLLPDSPVPDGVITVIDVGSEFHPPAFVSQGGLLPDSIREQLPLTVSDGYRSAYCWSIDRRTLIAYMCNSAEHITKDYKACLGGRLHRVPKSQCYSFTLQQFPSIPLVLKLYDATEKRLVKSESFFKTITIKIENTASDYLLLVTPGTTN